jgi:hypothetical protein
LVRPPIGEWGSGGVRRFFVDDSPATNLDLSIDAGMTALKARSASIPAQRATRLVFDDAVSKGSVPFEVDRFAHPRERVFLVRKTHQADLRGPPVGDGADSP